MKTLSNYYQNIILHIGAHRTGSSSLQAALHIAESDLAHTGVDIIVPRVPGFRENSDHRQALSHLLKHDRNRRVKHFPGSIGAAFKFRKCARNYLMHAPRKNTDLIWSDENILGKAISPDAPGVLYPEAFENLRTLKDIAGKNVSRVVMSIRSYPEFLMSYEIMQQSYGGGGIGLNQIESWAGSNFLGWTRLAKILPEIFDGASIEIWPFSKFEVSDLFRQLTGRNITESRRIELKDIVNASATKEALRELSELKTFQFLEKSDIDKVIFNYKEGQKIKEYEIFSADFLRFLYNCYDADSQEIFDSVSMNCKSEDLEK